MNLCVRSGYSNQSRCERQLVSLECRAIVRGGRSTCASSNNSNFLFKCTLVLSHWSNTWTLQARNDTKENTLPVPRNNVAQTNRHEMKELALCRTEMWIVCVCPTCVVTLFMNYIMVWALDVNSWPPNQRRLCKECHGRPIIIVKWSEWQLTNSFTSSWFSFIFCSLWIHTLNRLYVYMWLQQNRAFRPVGSQHRLPTLMWISFVCMPISTNQNTCVQSCVYARSLKNRTSSNIIHRFHGIDISQHQPCHLHVLYYRSTYINLTHEPSYSARWLIRRGFYENSSCPYTVISLT